MAKSENIEMSLNKKITEFLMDEGAIRVGFATKESVAGGPPSTDFDYMFKSAGIDADANSAISFALPLDKEAIKLFIAKQEREPHEEDNRRTLAKSVYLSHKLAGILQEAGHEAIGSAANLKYREEMHQWNRFLPPDISHRYIAVASGVGSFGWSGNVGVNGYGAAIILGTTVTSATLEPTAPLPDHESFCEWKKSDGQVKCKLCADSCIAEMFDKNDAEYVSLGSRTYSYARRRNTRRCEFGCGGFTGLHPSGKWSTWSPARFKLPDDPKKLNREYIRAIRQHIERPPMPNAADVPSVPGLKLATTCGMCQLVCFGDKKENAKNYKLLTKSGCAVQEPDGTIVILSPEEAEKKLQQMPEEHTALYS